MSDEIKAAHVYSAQRNEDASVACPHCEKRFKCEVGELEGVHYYDCPFCEEEFKIDFDEFYNSFIPVFKIPTQHD